MSGWLAILIGVLAAAGAHLMLRRDLARVVFGIILLGHAVNLLVFTMAGGLRSAAPLVPRGASLPPEPYVDPLPQALVLTAIVIGFAIQAFALVLFLGRRESPAPVSSQRPPTGAAGARGPSEEPG